MTPETLEYLDLCVVSVPDPDVALGPDGRVTDHAERPTTPVDRARTAFRLAARVKSARQQRVEAFMRAAGQPVRAVPTWPPAGERLRAARLILEEALETIQALGMTVCADAYVEVPEHPILPEDAAAALAEVVDGCVDLGVVALAALSMCGVADEAVALEVDLDNLRKFGPGHNVDQYGKLLKPPDHPGPRLRALVEAQYGVWAPPVQTPDSEESP